MLFYNGRVALRELELFLELVLPLLRGLFLASLNAALALEDDLVLLEAHLVSLVIGCTVADAVASCAGNLCQLRGLPSSRLAFTTLFVISLRRTHLGAFFLAGGVRLLGLVPASHWLQEDSIRGDARVPGL